MRDRGAGRSTGNVALLRGSARRLIALRHDPTLEALQTRLRELALGAVSRGGRPSSEADVRYAELKAQIAQTEILLATQDARGVQLPMRYERLRELRAWKVEGEPLDIDFVARLVRITSFRLGIRSRRHSEEEAIEASKGIKFQDLPAIEKRAAEIVLGRRRAAKNNGADAASQIANQLRREWLAPVPWARRNKGTPLSISAIVRASVPILDELAGTPIASGIPTTRELPSMKPAGMAALFAIVQLGYGTATPLESVYVALLEFRRRQTDAAVSV